MSTEKSDAIVLRATPWSETSLIASIYTREHGKISVLAKGARRPKSAFEAALDLLSICRVVFIAKPGDSLDLLTEAKLVSRYRAGTRDLLRLYAGYYVAELLEKMTDHGDRQPEIYDLAADTLHQLSNQALNVSAIVLRFELQMLRLTGHLPNWELCVQCGAELSDARWQAFSLVAGGIVCERCVTGARFLVRIPASLCQTFIDFSDSDWKAINLDQIDSNQKATLRAAITKYLTVVLDRKLQMHSYLEELGR